MFCKYSDIFGKPNTGVHSYRLFNIAIVDLAMTAIFAYFFAIYIKQPFIYVFLITIIVGIIMHRLFCVRTTIDKFLFS
jgi:hypothetical protein